MVMVISLYARILKVIPTRILFSNTLANYLLDVKTTEWRKY